MSPMPSKRRVDEGWLRALYAECWKQYSHEDTLGQSRNTVFLGVQAALVAILTALTPVFLDLSPTRMGSRRLATGPAALGVAMIVVGLFGLRLTTLWRAATRAGRLYVHLRRITLVALERVAGLGEIAPAEVEERWRKWSAERTENTERFHPFHDARLQDLSIERYDPPGGWESLRRTIGALRWLWASTLALGIALEIASGLILLQRNP